MDIGEIVLMLVIGATAGFINSVAGGGSLLTLPLLIFFGMPSAVANGTNRIAILFSNFIAILSFRKSGFFNWKLGCLLGLPSVIGSIIGAHFAVTMSDNIFNKILSIVMILILISIVWKPKKKKVNEDNQESKAEDIELTEEQTAQLRKIKLRKNIILATAFFFVGIYGGFIHAGVGFLIIAALRQLSHYSLIEINSLKAFVITLYMFFSLLVYVINDQVNWGYGIALAIGAGIGAWIGSQMAVSRGEKWIQRFLIIAIVALSIKLWFT